MRRLGELIPNMKERNVKISSAYPSNYLKADDLQGRRFTLTIERVAIENVGGQDNPEHKPCLYFQATQKGMVLNKTNAMNVSILYGDETDLWVGKQVELYVTQVPFQGRNVPAIRIMGPSTQATTLASQPLPDGRPTAPAVSSQGGLSDPDDDPIPF